MPDENMVFSDSPIPSIRKALTNSELVKELILLCNEKDQIIYNSNSRICSLPKELLVKIDLILKHLNQEVKHYELCPCQSGLKYKKCCGKV